MGRVWVCSVVVDVVVVVVVVTPLPPFLSVNVVDDSVVTVSKGWTYVVE